MIPQPEKPNRSGAKSSRRQAPVIDPFASNPDAQSDFSGSLGSDSFGRTTNQTPAFANEGSAQRGEPGTMAQDALDAVKGVMGEVTAQAKEFASSLTDELGSSAKSGVRRGSDMMQGFAQAMQTAARELDSQSPGTAQRVRRTAQQIETLSDSIRDRSVSELFAAATDLARRQPTAFITGAVFAGFALSRFLKSTSVSSTSTSPPNPDIDVAGGQPGSTL